MPLFRMAGNPLGRFMSGAVRAVPVVGDFMGAAAELVNPEEPSMVQRAKNALVVGGAGLGVSAATGGLDAVPQIVDLVTEYTGIKGPAKLQQMQRCARMANPDQHLREVAYSEKGGTGYWKGNFTQDVAACEKFMRPSTGAYRPSATPPTLNYVIQGGQMF